MKRIVMLGCLLAAAASTTRVAADNAAPGVDAGIVAAQVRAQGLPCAEPVHAVRDAQQSRPDEAVWTLRCADATYRVRLTPDERADVEVLQK